MSQNEFNDLINEAARLRQQSKLLREEWKAKREELRRVILDSLKGV